MATKKKRRDSTKKKDAILQTVLQLFLKKGYNATSTSDICAAAKLAKPTLYYYFGSKRNLLFSLHHDHLTKILLPYLEEATKIQDPAVRLAFMIKAYTRMICTHPELKFLIHETLEFKDKYFEAIKKDWKKHYLLLSRTIEELQASGLANASVKPSLAALFLIGMITWMTFWFDFSKKQHIEEMADTALTFASQALNLAPGENGAPATKAAIQPQ